MKKNGLAAWQLTMLALGTVVGGYFWLGKNGSIFGKCRPCPAAFNR
ncbi:MAG: hypothetical protein PWQ96_758 [Clostridia bacterium]|jgi:L-asparagine transporter-like permease|nr:hypothetical protein [Clostridiales bacterium]MDK2985116.1 hypothetical protein [Clostridia bacterium]